MLLVSLQTRTQGEIIPAAARHTSARGGRCPGHLRAPACGRYEMRFPLHKRQHQLPTGLPGSRLDRASTGGGGGDPTVIPRTHPPPPSPDCHLLDRSVPEDGQLHLGQACSRCSLLRLAAASSLTAAAVGRCCWCCRCRLSTIPTAAPAAAAAAILSARALRGRAAGPASLPSVILPCCACCA